MATDKSYWLDEEKFSGRPGVDIHKAMAECFADFYNSDKRNKVSISLNGVLVTLEKKRF